MKNICLILAITLTISCVYSLDYAKDGFPPLVSTNSTQSYGKLSQAEFAILGQTYEKQTIGIRLNRLEKTLFNKTYPRLTNEQRINNIIVNYKNQTNSKSFPNLGILEQKIFNQNYSYDTDANRIARLEQAVMGTIQSGDFINRYKRLERIIAHYPNKHNSFNTYSYNPYNSVPIIQSGGGWRGLAGSLGNFFSGYPTGFSPQINTPYLTPDNFRGHYNNHGWREHNTYNGSGVGVHILD